MNLKSNKKSKFWCIPYVMLTLLAFFLGSCDDGKEVSPITGSGGTPFNPAFPIRIDSIYPCLLYTSPSPRDSTSSRMPSSA